MLNFCNFDVIEIPAQEIDEVNVSSTKIRDAILKGEIELANEFLGAPFQLNGKVVEGKALGRTIGFPTANIEMNSDLKLIPAKGVYAIKVFVKGRWYVGMLNIGFRPTISEESNQTIEVHIFDFADNIYGENITVQFLSKWRDEMKFNGVEELKNQLKKDEEIIRHIVADFV